MNFNEIYYMIMNKPYFKVFVLSNGRKVKTFIQLAASTEKAEKFFLICKSLNSAWRKPTKPVIDGVKFETYVDIKNAIPLEVKTATEYYETDYLIKQYKVETISEDMKKQGENLKSGAPETLIEIAYPPTVLFQELEAHFVKEVLQAPATKFDNLGNLLMWGLIIGAIIIFVMMNKGSIPFLN